MTTQLQNAFNHIANSKFWRSSLEWIITWALIIAIILCLT